MAVAKVRLAGSISSNATTEGVSFIVNLQSLGPKPLIRQNDEKPQTRPGAFMV